MNEKRGRRRFIISDKVVGGDVPQARRQAVPRAKSELEAARQSRPERFAARDFGSLLGMPGLSEALLQAHFELYQGYVKNANTILIELEQRARDGRLDSPAAAELRRRFGWEYDSIRLHEYYFENLSKTPKALEPGSRLHQRMTEDYGGFEQWKKDFLAAGAMRGIGWVVTYLDPLRSRLFNTWINEHDEGHLVGCTPIIVMDVFEHAYLLDYGVKKAGYLEAFFKALNWDAATSRMM